MVAVMIRGYSRSMIRGYSRSMIRGYSRSMIRGYSRSMIIAMPCPPPTHMVSRP